MKRKKILKYKNEAKVKILMKLKTQLFMKKSLIAQTRTKTQEINFRILNLSTSKKKKIFV